MHHSSASELSQGISYCNTADRLIDAVSEKTLAVICSQKESTERNVAAELRMQVGARLCLGKHRWVY